MAAVTCMVKETWNGITGDEYTERGLMVDSEEGCLFISEHGTIYGKGIEGLCSHQRGD